jgi:hypothetical protein
MKPIRALMVALVSFVPTLALAADISGYWSGWSCGVQDSYSCPATTGYYDNISRLHFAADPKTGLNTATWTYPTSGVDCSSVLTYVSDIGGGVTGAYHWWQFTDTPQNGCLSGSVVVAVKVGTTEPMQVWWYASNPNYSISNTFGYLTPYSRQ